MKQWAADIIAADKKKSLPVLSFPGIQLINVSMPELLDSAENQTKCLKAVAERSDTFASVSFMDLSIEAEAFGCPICRTDDEVPTVTAGIIDEDTDIDEVHVPSVGEGRTGFAVDAIADAAKEINDRPLLAGTIGPFSLTGRLMDVNEVMFLCFDEPELVHATLEKVTSFLIEYTMAMKNAGADGVVIAEPMAGLLEADLAEEFSAPYVKRIVDAVQDDEFAVVYHNCGNSVPQQIESIVSTGAAGFHFGNAINMADIMPYIPEDKFAAGNVDPAGEIRNGTPESIRETTLALMESCGQYKNFIPSTGCDIPPMAPWENIDAFFAAVEEYYAK